MESNLTILLTLWCHKSVCSLYKLNNRQAKQGEITRKTQNNNNKVVQNRTACFIIRWPTQKGRPSVLFVCVCVILLFQQHHIYIIHCSGLILQCIIFQWQVVNIQHRSQQKSQHVVICSKCNESTYIFEKYNCCEVIAVG